MKVLNKHQKVIYVHNATWWIFNGTLTEAKELPDTCRHKYFDGELGPLCLQSQKRPEDFMKLAPESQWEIDKRLGILDWSGEPTE